MWIAAIVNQYTQLTKFSKTNFFLFEEIPGYMYIYMYMYGSAAQIWYSHLYII